LILDGVVDFVDGKPERTKLLYRLVGSKRTWRKDLECLSLVGRLPPVSILGMGGGLVQRFRLSPVVTMLRGVVGRKSLLPPPTECRAMLGIEPRSSE